MYNNPDNMSEAKVKSFILVVLSLLLVLIIVLIVRTFNEPAPVAATQIPPSISNPVSSMQQGGYFPVGAQISSPPTDVPTAVPTETPEPTPQPTATPKPTEIMTLRKGDNNEQVRQMQQRLIELDYMQQGSADGKFGSGTKVAVQEFQRNNGLAPDGAAGRETLTKLFSTDAR